MNLSPHIQQLIDENYHVEIREDKFLLIKRVPYLNKDLEIRYGIIISPLELNGDNAKLEPDHPIFFSGEHPYKTDGTKFNPNTIERKELLPGLFADFLFSFKKENKPYPNYYEKMKHYVHLFSKHAMQKDPAVTFDIGSLVEVPSNSAFQYSDCNSASPEVNVLLERFIDMKIGIVGMGGTGSYILDFISKTPVKEIHLFDADYYHNKNAFRSPGATHIDSLVNVQQKVEYFQKEYSKIHKGVIAHPNHIVEDDLHDLSNLSFVFIAIDKSAIKKPIIEYLERNQINFIDVGMGIKLENEALLGQMRVTTSTVHKRDHIISNNRIKFVENKNNDYSKVPQIAELNALNASLAVIKWKKLVGFYHDRSGEHHSIFRLPFNNILNFDF